MDTKLRKISNSTWIKTIAFLLVIASFASAFSLLADMLVSSNGAAELFEEDYLSSRNGEHYIYDHIEALLRFKNEDNIKELGRQSYEKEVSDKVELLNSAVQYLTDMQGIYYYATDGESIFTNCSMTSAVEFRKFGLFNITDGHSGESTFSFYVDEYIPQSMEAKVYIALEEEAVGYADIMYSRLTTLFLLKSQAHIEAYALTRMEESIFYDMLYFAESQSTLAGRSQGIYYYAADGESVFTNCTMTTADEFKKFEYYNITDGYFEDLKIGGTFIRPQEGKKIFVAFDDDFIMKKQMEFEQTKAVLQQEVLKILVALIIGLLLLVYLIFVCGRDTDKKMNMLAVDRLWTEITFVALMLVVAMFLVFNVTIARGEYRIYSEFQPVVTVVTAVFCAVGLTFFFSLVRHIKNKTLIKHSLVYTVYRKIGGVFKILFNLTPLKFKIVGAISGAALVTFILTAIGCGTGSSEFAMLVFLLTTAITVGIVYAVLKFVIKPYDDEVNSRLEVSLQKAMKAERLKTDLITNVSHDLKTPLTAILNYATLLLERDKNDEYAEVIYEKSIKLKTLTEDLFEVSKVQSGNIVTNIEKLKVAELIDQMLTEADEHVVQFKTNIEDVSIAADGRLMSRVFENLIGNINKYSMPGTRAYIDAFEKDGQTHIVFKNMASYEMNFDASEMTERFSRGDSSRTTDGNGLGLAIAQSYTEACGGKLKIDIDGDLFKVTLIFK